MRLVVFSDCDGTLLDHHTYRVDEAREGLAILRRKRIPLILVSSKTCDEMGELAADLGLDGPYIFENGGGIRWPLKDKTECLSPSVEELRAGVHLLKQLLATDVRFIIDMTPEEIATLTGLTMERARMARMRRTSLPFLLKGGERLSVEQIETLNKNLAQAGYRVISGARFYHFLSVNVCKGHAVKTIIERFRQEKGDFVSAAIGDSENDLSMLEAVDYPFLVRRPNGSAIRPVDGRVRIVNGIGPAGFTEAISAIVKEIEC